MKNNDWATRLVIAIAFVVAVMVATAVVIMVTIVLALADLLLVNIAVVFTRPKIPFAIRSPRVVVVYTAVVSIPVAIEESLSVVTGCNPVSAGIG
jgi:hypothetical protein